jgi:cell fate regulator YaaT (PSP1 superfamily)
VSNRDGTATLVGLRFTRLGRVRYFDAGEHRLDVGERIVVETEEGRSEAEVAIAPSQVLYSDLKGAPEPLIVVDDP